MNPKFFMRVMAVVACVATFAVSDEAEAGRWHRRRECCDPCVTPVCCEPVCATACAPSCCVPAYETVTWVDSCGRLVSRRVACCETIASSTIVVPASSCCGLAGTTSADAGSVAETPARESVIAATASIVK